MKHIDSRWLILHTSLELGKHLLKFLLKASEWCSTNQSKKEYYQTNMFDSCRRCRTMHNRERGLAIATMNIIITMSNLRRM